MGFDQFNIKESNEPWGENGNYKTYRLVKDGKIRGMFGFQEVPGKNGKIAVIDSVELDPEFRGRGLGTTMYKRIIDYAADNGYDKVITLGSGASPDAARVWESLKKQGVPVEETTGTLKTGPIKGHKTFRIDLKKYRSSNEQ